MEIGPVTRPGLSHVGSVSRIVPPSAAAPVGGQLPERAVEQAPAAPTAQPDPARPSPAQREDVDRRIDIDPVTQQVIYRAIDKVSGEVVRQVPEETLLRLRIYAQALRHRDSEKSRGLSLIA